MRQQHPMGGAFALPDETRRRPYGAKKRRGCQQEDGSRWHPQKKDGGRIANSVVLTTLGHCDSGSGFFIWCIF